VNVLKEKFDVGASSLAVEQVSLLLNVSSPESSPNSFTSATLLKKVGSGLS
jgi:hypothetical protein